ncbi:hypothetical protein DFH27DRAFT_522592 [Peziza echinospora]|nr:hypothetical protein DFH27DRAFT_522592 [Peziza echinospora]
MPTASEEKQAEDLKNQGNSYFKKGDFPTATKLYSSAIHLNPTNATYYTNRALSNVKQSLWTLVIADCHRAIELLPDSLKAYSYLGQAQYELDRPLEALEASKRAYELSIQQRSPSSASIATHVLKAKKRVWEVTEEQRILSENTLLSKLLSNPTLSDLEKDEIKKVWARANPETAKPRVVPDYFIDNITFSVMVDPVVTKHGQSYDRASLLEHLKRSKTDPLTREPLGEEDLRPNLALREACEEYIRENGWAVDW